MDRIADLLVEIDSPSAAFVALMIWWAGTNEPTKLPPVAELGQIESPASLGRLESPARVPQPTEALTSRSHPTIDINKASAAELEDLPGIGTKRAAAIVVYRAEHGPFVSLDDLIRVPGIGRKTVEKIGKEISTTQ